jgi:hypothetical protein
LPSRSLLALCAFVAGCASVPQVPAELDLRRAAIVEAASAPTLVLDGPSGKGSAAGAGAAKGGGIGFVLGGLACLGTGPLAAVCLAAMVPAGAAIGAASGAVVGAVQAEGADEVQAKRELLERELASSPPTSRLATQLQQELLGGARVEVPIADATATPPLWTLRVNTHEVGTSGLESGATYALQASASLTVARAGDAQPAFVKNYQVASNAKLTTAEWGANGGAPVRSALHDLSAGLARMMAADLRAGPESKTPNR